MNQEIFNISSNEVIYWSFYRFSYSILQLKMLSAEHEVQELRTSIVSNLQTSIRRIEVLVQQVLIPTC
ncbi:hypothetical protein QQG55_4350 [Brugia pahangi]